MLIKMKKIIGLFVMAFMSLSNAFAASSCLDYSPKINVIEGIIKPIVFAGPPNFSSVKNGDKPEKYWVLYSTYPTCLNSNEDVDVDYANEQNVKEIQLIIDNYSKYKNMTGKSVRVYGRLIHAISGHHHTNILMDVTKIELLK